VWEGSEEGGVAGKDCGEGVVVLLYLAASLFD
jgi:hypothetical protein